MRPTVTQAVMCLVLRLVTSSPQLEVQSAPIPGVGRLAASQGDLPSTQPLVPGRAMLGHLGSWMCPSHLPVLMWHFCFPRARATVAGHVPPRTLSK